MAELSLVLRSAIGAEPGAVSLRLSCLLRVTLRRHLPGVSLLRVALLGHLSGITLLRISLRRHLSRVALLRISLRRHLPGIALLLETLLRVALLEALLLLHTHALLLESLLHTLLRITLLHVTLLLHALLRIALLVTGGHPGACSHTGYAAYGAHACVHTHTHALIRYSGSRLT